jgi:hypothetical protein
MMSEATNITVRQPLFAVAVSTLAAGLVLASALRVSRPSAGDEPHSQLLQNTPEHAAETFVAAFRAGDYTRAARFASGSFARALRARAKREPPEPSDDSRHLILQESYILPGERLRLSGVLVQTGEDESSGWPISLTLIRADARYWVDDLSWPKGPPPRTP